MSLNETPRANRLHIGFFGKRNSGKSSLINAFTGQGISIVSDVAGTTTDPVYKSMEIHGIGPCVLIDTAGFDDEGTLGRIRVEKTRQAAEKTDIAVIIFSGDEIEEEVEWYRSFKKKSTPILPLVGKADLWEEAMHTSSLVEKELGVKPLPVTAIERKSGSSEAKLPEGAGNLRLFKDMLVRLIPEGFEMDSITGDLAGEGDTVLLVMPQDIQAPKGRLILPQVQTLRDLLDKKCIVMSATTDKLDEALAAMSAPPKLIITDSQVFKTVYEKKPAESMLTSFSTLFAAYKGDIDYFVEGAAAIEKLTEDSKVLIAEACTHAPLTEDIGREKLPRMLKKKVGAGLTVDLVSGTDFPQDLSKYDLIIQCGACMFNRKYVMSRVELAKDQGTAMSNYGVVIAYLNDILDKISC